MIDTLEVAACDEVRTRWGSAPQWIARAPGRVELLGNHTDHNGGLVISAAIDRFTVVAGMEVPDWYRPCRVVAARFGEWTRVAPHVHPPMVDGRPLPEVPAGSWTRYVGAVLATSWAGPTFGDDAPPRFDAIDAAIVGDLPLGAGLSSSASLEASLAVFVRAVERAGRPVELTDPTRLAIARALRRVENERIGVGCGLLDPFSVMMGRAGHALLLDCRTEQFERLPLGTPPPAIVVCDSKTSRRLADGMYDRRRAECQAAVAAFRQWRGPEIAELRDVTPEDLKAHWARLDPTARKRARHVVTENERVRQGVAALTAGDLATLGRLMSQSHASSRDDFENSSPALDALIEAAEAAPGFLGGKLSGGGWAGCTVNLVAAEQAEAFAEAVRSGYARRTGVVAEVHLCQAAEGASVRRLDP